MRSALEALQKKSLVDCISGYSSKPLNFNSPRLERGLSKSQSHLFKAYVAWKDISKLVDSFEVYSSALEVLSGLDLSVDLVTAFLVSNPDVLVPYDGIFVSAALNICPEKEIVYDVPGVPSLDYIGLNLVFGKTLLVYSPVGNSTGDFSDGTIIFFGDADVITSVGGTNLVVSAADSAYSRGTQSGLFFNFGKIGSLSHNQIVYSRPFSQMIVNLGCLDWVVDCCKYWQGFLLSKENLTKSMLSKMDMASKPPIMHGREYRSHPELARYLEDFKSSIMSNRSSPKKLFAFIRSLGGNPGKSVAKKISSFLPERYLDSLCERIGNPQNIHALCEEIKNRGVKCL